MSRQIAQKRQNFRMKIRKERKEEIFSKRRAKAYLSSISDQEHNNQLETASENPDQILKYRQFIEVELLKLTEESLNALLLTSTSSQSEKGVDHESFMMSSMGSNNCSGRLISGLRKITQTIPPLVDELNDLNSFKIESVQKVMSSFLVHDGSDYSLNENWSMHLLKLSLFNQVGNFCVKALSFALSLLRKQCKPDALNYELLTLVSSIMVEITNLHQQSSHNFSMNSLFGREQKISIYKQSDIYLSLKRSTESVTHQSETTMELAINHLQTLQSEAFSRQVVEFKINCFYILGNVLSDMILVQSTNKSLHQETIGFAQRFSKDQYLDRAMQALQLLYVDRSLFYADLSQILEKESFDVIKQSVQTYRSFLEYVSCQIWITRMLVLVEKDVAFEQKIQFTETIFKGTHDVVVCLSAVLEKIVLKNKDYLNINEGLRYVSEALLQLEIIYPEFSSLCQMVDADNGNYTQSQNQHFSFNSHHSSLESIERLMTGVRSLLNNLQTKFLLKNQNTKNPSFVSKNMLKKLQKSDAKQKALNNVAHLFPLNNCYRSFISLCCRVFNQRLQTKANKNSLPGILLEFLIECCSGNVLCTDCLDLPITLFQNICDSQFQRTGTEQELANCLQISFIGSLSNFFPCFSGKLRNETTLSQSISNLTWQLPDSLKNKYAHDVIKMISLCIKYCQQRECFKGNKKCPNILFGANRQNIGHENEIVQEDPDLKNQILQEQSALSILADTWGLKQSDFYSADGILTPSFAKEYLDFFVDLKKSEAEDSLRVQRAYIDHLFDFIITCSQETLHVFEQEVRENSNGVLDELLALNSYKDFYFAEKVQEILEELEVE